MSAPPLHRDHSLGSCRAARTGSSIGTIHLDAHLHPSSRRRRDLRVLRHSSPVVPYSNSAASELISILGTRDSMTGLRDVYVQQKVTPARGNRGRVVWSAVYQMGEWQASCPLTLEDRYPTEISAQCRFCSGTSMHYQRTSMCPRSQMLRLNR